MAAHFPAFRPPLSGENSASDYSSSIRQWKYATGHALLCLFLYLAGWTVIWLVFPASGHWLFIAAGFSGSWGRIQENITVALGMAAGMVILSILREVPLCVGVLTHEGSTANVVLNSLRLLLCEGPELKLPATSTPTPAYG